MLDFSQSTKARSEARPASRAGSPDRPQTRPSSSHLPSPSRLLSLSVTTTQTQLDTRSGQTPPARQPTTAKPPPRRTFRTLCSLRSRTTATTSRGPSSTDPRYHPDGACTTSRGCSSTRGAAKPRRDSAFKGARCFRKSTTIRSSPQPLGRAPIERSVLSPPSSVASSGLRLDRCISTGRLRGRRGHLLQNAGGVRRAGQDRHAESLPHRETCVRCTPVRPPSVAQDLCTL